MPSSVDILFLLRYLSNHCQEAAYQEKCEPRIAGKVVSSNGVADYEITADLKKFFSYTGHKNKSNSNLLLNTPSFEEDDKAVREIFRAFRLKINPTIPQNKALVEIAKKLSTPHAIVGFSPFED